MGREIEIVVGCSSEKKPERVVTESSRTRQRRGSDTVTARNTSDSPKLISEFVYRQKALVYCILRLSQAPVSTVDTSLRIQVASMSRTDTPHALET